MLTVTTDVLYEPGPELAIKFFDDILDTYETVSDVGTSWGDKTLVQAYYFSYGLLKNDPSVIDPEHLGEAFIKFLKTLPGHQYYFDYVERCRAHSANQRKPAL